MNKKELKSFFNKLVDARPEFAERMRDAAIERGPGFTEEEAYSLKRQYRNAREHLMMNPLRQNGIGSTDEKLEL